MGCTSSKVKESFKGEEKLNNDDATAEKSLVHFRHRDPGIPRGVPNAMEAEQIAAGWPSWLATVAGEAIWGWLPRRADTFEKLDRIGEGSYSSVYKARDITNGKIIALKKVRFDDLEPESVRFMAREIIILRRLDHPNVIKLEGLITSRLSCSLYLLFEYMEHDLTGIASLPGVAFTEAQIKCYMHQLLSGLAYCHDRGVLQRDIKSSNLLINDHGTLKIADFGLSTFFDSRQNLPLTSRVVTLWYRPPELLLGGTHYGVAIDLWSTGCVLAELYAGKPVMPGRTEVEQLHKIFKLCGSPSDDYWDKAKLPHATLFRPQQQYRRCVADAFKGISLEALELIETLLSIDPQNRGTAASALESKYFTTKPYACDPSTLPKYPPTKEIDVKSPGRFHRQLKKNGRQINRMVDEKMPEEQDRQVKEEKKRIKNRIRAKDQPPQSTQMTTNSSFISSINGDSPSIVSMDRVDQLLEEHDRHIQECAQRLRLDKKKKRAAKVQEDLGLRSAAVRT